VCRLNADNRFVHPRFMHKTLRSGVWQIPVCNEQYREKQTSDKKEISTEGHLIITTRNVCGGYKRQLEICSRSPNLGDRAGDSLSHPGAGVEVIPTRGTGDLFEKTPT
jgi:hypothetical protein